MKLQYLLVLSMSIFALSCGDNKSGGKNKDDNGSGDLVISKSNTSNPDCQFVHTYGAYLRDNGKNYEIDWSSNQQLYQEVGALYQYAAQMGNGGNGYPTGNQNYYSQYNIVRQDQCSVTYRISYDGDTNNYNNGGYGNGGYGNGGYGNGGYGNQSNMTILSITNYDIK